LPLLSADWLIASLIAARLLAAEDDASFVVAGRV